MSIRARGVFRLNSYDCSIGEQIDLAFIATIKAAEYRMGLKLGGNANFSIIENVESLHKIPFELTDDPLDVNAECLFIGDDIEVRLQNVRVDMNESLSSRMGRVQKFFYDILNINIIKSIELYLNIEEGDEFDTIEICINDFQSKIIDLYKQEDNWTPTVKLVIYPI